MLPLSLSYDHRVIDGADAARFLRWVAEAFEQPFVLRALTHGVDSSTQARRHRRRPGRLRGRVLRRRPRHAGHAHRSGDEPRRRLPLSRLHSVEGAAARRRGHQRGEARRGVGRHVRRRRRSISTKLRAFKDKVVTQLTGGARPALEAAQDHLRAAARRRSAMRARSRSSEGRHGTRASLTFEHAIVATGSRPASIPGLTDRQPARDGFHRRARSARRARSRCSSSAAATSASSWAASTRRSGSKVTVVEMTAGLLPGADRDLVNILAKRIEQICEAVLLNTQGRRDEGDEGRHRRHLRGRGPGDEPRERTFDRVLVSIGRRPELGSTRPRQDGGQGRTPAASSRSTSAGGPPSRRSTRSATSSASRCSRTRRRTRRASPSMRSPASGSRSSRWRSRRSSSPIPRSPGAG